MFSSFICMSFMKSGRCDKGPACKLHHVTDIEKLDVAEKIRRPVTAAVADKSASSKKIVEEEKKMPKVKESDRHDADGFLTGSKRADATLMHKRRLEEKEITAKKSQRCSFLFSKGTCKYGDRCFYSHEGFRIAGPTGEAPRTDRVRVPRPSYVRPTPVGDWASPSDTPLEVWPVFSSIPAASRGRDRPMRETARAPRRTFEAVPVEEKPKAEENDRYENASASGDEEVVEDYEALDEQVKKIYKDLSRLEPVRKAMGAGKSIDIMFIIDCTGSMGSWIEASKREIKSIIDCVKNQHFNI